MRFRSIADPSKTIQQGEMRSRKEERNAYMLICSKLAAFEGATRPCSFHSITVVEMTAPCCRGIRFVMLATYMASIYSLFHIRLICEQNINHRQTLQRNEKQIASDLFFHCTDESANRGELVGERDACHTATSIDLLAMLTCRPRQGGMYTDFSRQI